MRCSATRRTSSGCPLSATRSNRPRSSPRSRQRRARAPSTTCSAEKQVPADAYYGVQTARALENFQISGIADQSLSGVRRGVGHRQARRGARQHQGRRDEAGAARRDREGVPGGARRQVPRSVPGRLVPGRRRHVDQHERQRGAGQHRPRADRPQEGRVPVPRAARRPEHVAVDERLVSDRDQGRASSCATTS